MTPADDLAFFEQLADGVSEGYAATYAQRWERDIGVHAIRLEPGTRLRTVFSEYPRSGVSRRFTFGDVHVAVYGDSGGCSKAIEAHLQSLN
jgi:hypothetical protein